MAVDEDGLCTRHNEPLREDCWSCRDDAVERYWKHKVEKLEKRIDELEGKLKVAPSLENK